MPNLLNDNVTQILRGLVVNGQPQPDQAVSSDLSGQIIPTQSTNAESTQLLQDALTRLTALEARVRALENP